MGLQVTNSDYLTSLLAITRDQYINSGAVQDNVFNNQAVLFALEERSEVIIRDGGVNLVVDLLVSDNTTTDSYSGYAKLDTSPQKGIINGYLPPAYYATALTFADTELKQNTGEAAVAKLFAARMMQAEGSQRTRINADIYLDGTGNGGQDLTGLKSMIPNASGADTYMYVTSATAKWKHVYIEATSANTLTGLDNTFYAISDGVDQPDLVITSPIGIRNYERLNRASGIGVSYLNTKLADAGFISVAYKGHDMILDQEHPNYVSDATVPVYHMLCTKYLGFYYKTDITDFVRPGDQLGKVAYLTTDCQLLTNNRRRQGKLVITA